MLIIYLQQLIVFALLRSKISSGALVTAESVVYLAIYHFHEIIYSYGEWTMDASALLMILVCKYSLLAYALEDGRAHPEILTAEQQANRIPEQITLWNFLGYTNFLPTGLLGPPFEFRDYLKFMNLAHPYDHIHSVQKIVAKTAGETVVCAVIYAFG